MEQNNVVIFPLSYCTLYKPVPGMAMGITAADLSLPNLKKDLNS